MLASAKEGALADTLSVALDLTNNLDKDKTQREPRERSKLKIEHLAKELAPLLGLEAKRDAASLDPFLRACQRRACTSAFEKQKVEGGG